MRIPSTARPANRAALVLATCVLIPSAVLTSESITRDSLRPVVVSARDVHRADLSVAIFAGGCFWSMERPFDNIPGVVATTVGYEGGSIEHPTYPQVNTGTTGHAEAVRVTFDSTKVSYAKLLDVYWRNIDPFTREAQFCDRGNEYRTVIFYLNDTQKLAAESSRTATAAALIGFGPVVTDVVPATTFWPAESFHQHYADHNAVRYAMYRLGCGRDERLQKIWGDSAEPYVPSK